MIIEDGVLPAAAHLTGAGAADVLRPVVEASGGELIGCRTSQVQYRPSSDLVVRYRCEVRRGGVVTSDTLLAATAIGGPPPGTVPVEAVQPDGSRLVVGVWRWPFDPYLVELPSIVTPHLAAQRLDPVVGGVTDVEVVAYRPAERAVLRVRGAARTVYVKVVPTPVAEGLVRRHESLGTAGIPVPRVLAAGDGWIALEALDGTTLRDRLRLGTAILPAPARYLELLDALAPVELADAAPVRSRLDDAPHHAAVLAAVLPGLRTRLDEIVGRLGDTTRHLTGTVHGDLHESQLVVDDRGVTGLLDLDDAGPGDPLDDVGTLLAHLRFRAAMGGPTAALVQAHADALHRAVVDRHDGREVDRRVAAVLVGLATGPFRIQQPALADLTSRVLDLVDAHLPNG